VKNCVKNLNYVSGGQQDVVLERIFVATTSQFWIQKN